MPKKKDDPKELGDQDKLNRRVDVIMDPKQPDVPPLDMFEDAKTAPELPGKAPDKAHQETSKPTATAKIVRVADSSQASEEPPKDPINKKDPLDDEATDEAVNDIAAKESNTLLALQDAIGDKATRVAGNLAEQDRKKALHRHWFWLIFVLVFIVLVLLALPLDSYTCRWPVGIHLRLTTDIFPSVCK